MIKKERSEIRKIISILFFSLSLCSLGAMEKQRKYFQKELDNALVSAIVFKDAGQLDKVTLLLEKGANIHCRQKGSFTPLHWAAGLNNVPVARILVEHGASLQARDDDGMTPMDIAAAKGNQEVLSFLARSYIKICWQNDNGY